MSTKKKAAKTTKKRTLLDVLKLSMEKVGKKLLFVKAQLGRFEHKSAVSAASQLDAFVTELPNVQKAIDGIPADLAPISRKGQQAPFAAGEKVTIREKFKDDYKDVVNGDPLVVIKQPGRFVECKTKGGAGIMIIRGHLMLASEATN